MYYLNGLKNKRDPHFKRDQGRINFSYQNALKQSSCLFFLFLFEFDFPRKIWYKIKIGVYCTLFRLCCTIHGLSKHFQNTLGFLKNISWWELTSLDIKKVRYRNLRFKFYFVSECLLSAMNFFTGKKQNAFEKDMRISGSGCVQTSFLSPILAWSGLWFFNSALSKRDSNDFRLMVKIFSEKETIILIYASDATLLNQSNWFKVFIFYFLFFLFIYFFWRKVMFFSF